MKNFTPPPLAFSIEKASVIIRFKESFSIWCHDIVPHMPRVGRYTTGARIENHFLDLLELIYTAYYASLENKNSVIVKAISKNDIIKYLLQIAFENKLIKDKEYLKLSSRLQEVGNILGGWKKAIDQKNFPNKNSHIIWEKIFVSKEGSIEGIPPVRSVELVHVHVPTVRVEPDVDLAKRTFCDKTIRSTTLRVVVRLNIIWENRTPLVLSPTNNFIF